MHIEITNDQARVSVNEKRIRAAIQDVAAEEGYDDCTISVAVVDDATMHTLNRRYLDHDYATDVLSFVLELDEERARLEGEIIVSGDMAASVAPRFGWLPEDELLLYVIHGALHLVGYDDQSPADAIEMRQLETHHLARFGLQPRYRETGSEAGPSQMQPCELLREGTQP